MPSTPISYQTCLSVELSARPRINRPVHVFPYFHSESSRMSRVSRVESIEESNQCKEKRTGTRTAASLVRLARLLVFLTYPYPMVSWALVLPCYRQYWRSFPWHSHCDWTEQKPPAPDQTSCLQQWRGPWHSPTQRACQ